MSPDSIHAESTVTFTDSCNQCFCFGWKRRNKTKDKVATQASKISRQESPRRTEHQVTNMHLDVTTTTTEDVEFIQANKDDNLKK